MKIKKYLERFIFGIYPPYLGAGIKVKHISDDYRKIVVEMKLRFWNRNYVNTHFGGSLYSMVDPFFMLMLMKNLGPDYIVWDKSAKIAFKKPGKGKMRATFLIDDAMIKKIKSDVEQMNKIEPEFKVDIENEDGEIIASIEKLLYIRKKEKKV